MIEAVIGILIGALLGGTFLKISKIDPSISSGYFYLYGGLSLGLGFGLTSLGCFFQLLFNISKYGLIVFEILICFVSVIWIQKFNAKRLSASQEQIFLEETPPHLSKYFKLMLVFLISFFTLGFILYALNHPHGEWDSWAIWNHKARYFYRAFSQNRINLLDDLKTLSFAHQDYPLLIPLSIARIWTYGGKEIFAIPLIVNFLFVVGIALILYGSISHLGNNVSGMLSIVALFSCSYFLRKSADQMADVPISFFLLGAMVLFVLKDNLMENKWKKNYLMMAGVFTSMAAWVKNEGLMFFCCIILANCILVVFRKKNVRGIYEILWFVLGALPILLIIMLFKIKYAPQNDLFASNSISFILESILDPNRFWYILKSFFIEIFAVGKGLIIILPLLVIFFKNSENSVNPGNCQFVYLTILLILSGFFSIYLITPHELEWHVLTSLRRVLLQIYPSFIFAVFIQVSIPEESIPIWLRKY